MKKRPARAAHRAVGHRVRWRPVLFVVRALFLLLFRNHHRRSLLLFWLPSLALGRSRPVHRRRPVGGRKKQIENPNQKRPISVSSAKYLKKKQTRKTQRNHRREQKKPLALAEKVSGECPLCVCGCVCVCVCGCARLSGIVGHRS